MPGAGRADGGGLGADRGTQGAEHGSADGTGTGGGTGMPGAARGTAERADGTGSDGLRAFAADGSSVWLIPPERVVPLREAFFAPSEAVPLERAAGRVSAVPAGPYPPGVALITPGERVTEEMAAYLRALGPRRAFGLGPEGTLRCLR